QRGGDKNAKRRHIKQRVRRITPPLPGFSNNEIAVKSPDGKELFKFNGVGQHLETLAADSGKVQQRLEHDKAGRLMKIEDGAGKSVVRIERDAQGIPIAIVAPDGQRTALELD